MLGFMPIALLLISLASTGSGSVSPLRAELFETHLSAPVGSLVPELAASQLTPSSHLLPALEGSRGTEIYGGVRQIVSGSVCLGLGLLIGGLGVYGLIAAGNEMPGSARTVFTALGWTGFGIGAVLAIVGIPLLIVGIVRVSARNQLGLVIDERGSLLVRF
jgi:hypothetical protein